jgi:hypothetical protein
MSLTGDVTPIKIDDFLALSKREAGDQHLDFSLPDHQDSEWNLKNDPTIHYPRAYDRTCLVL